MKKNLRKILPGVLTLLFLGIYLFFPCGFSTTDAWHYAASVKYNTGLFHPFHLLYNVSGRVFCLLPVKAGAGTLACMKAMNAIFAALSVYIVFKILKLAGKNESTAAISSALCGASFSVMRYATENETYIIPLFWGLVSLLYLYSFFRYRKHFHALLSVFSAAVAVLFHASYIFWWACISIAVAVSGKRKAFLSSLAVSLVIPAAYILVNYITGNKFDYESFTGFRDIKELKELFGISPSGLLLSAINLIRSFVQIHGYMLNMLKESYLWFIPGFISVCLFAASLLNAGRIRINHGYMRPAAINILIAAVMFIFAVFSRGNAEFMVMIPVLAFIAAGMIMDNSEKFFALFLAAMVIWNLFYGIIPLNRQNAAAEKFLCEKLINDENSVVIARDDQLIAGMIFYNTGKPEQHIILKSPAVLRQAGKDPEILRGLIDKFLSEKREIYTDCLSIMPLSRAVLLGGKTDSLFFSSYEMQEVFSHRSITGRRVIHRITGLRQNITVSF